MMTSFTGWYGARFVQECLVCYEIQRRVQQWTVRLWTPWKEAQLHSFLTAALHRAMSATGSGHLTPEKEPRYALNRRLGGTQSRSGRFGQGFNCSTNQCWNLRQTSWTQTTPARPNNLCYGVFMYYFPSSTTYQQVSQTNCSLHLLFVSAQQYTGVLISP